MANAFSALVGIDVPIVQAAMGGVTSPVFAAAVSNAGGLGMLALSWSSPDDIRREIAETKALTSRPFGVNLILSEEPEERLAVCLAAGAPIVSFFWGQAGPLTETAKRAGAKVLHIVASAEAARRAVDDGADAVVAQGWEAVLNRMRVFASPDVLAAPMEISFAEHRALREYTQDALRSRLEPLITFGETCRRELGAIA